MRNTTMATVLAVLSARPAFAHPGHGMPGWLHHGEWLVVAALVAAVAVLWAVRRRDDRRR